MPQKITSRQHHIVVGGSPDTGMLEAERHALALDKRFPFPFAAVEAVFDAIRATVLADRERTDVVLRGLRREGIITQEQYGRIMQGLIAENRKPLP